MEAASAKKKENPLIIMYVKMLKFFLSSVGAWPSETLEDSYPLRLKIFRKYLPMQANIAILGQMYYLIDNFKEIDFYFIGHMYITLFLSILTEVRFLLPSFKRYGIILKRFYFTFHLVHLKHRGDYYEKMYNIIHKVSHYFTVYMVIASVGSLTFFNLVTIYYNWRIGVYTNNRVENSSLQHSVYLSYPGYDPDQHPFLTTTVNFYLSYCCSVSICFTDLLLYLVCFQIVGHILILDNNIKNLATNKMLTANNGFNHDVTSANFKLFNDEENLIIHRKIVEVVTHHKEIVSFTEDISDFFGPTLALNYSFQLFCCCLLLLECSTGQADVLIRYGIITVIIFGQLIQTSIIFEYVGTVSEKLKDSVYGVPWESMNIKNQRAVYILLNRTQNPITVTAMGMTTVGVQTMAGILKTTFSYFTFLRTME